MSASFCLAWALAACGTTKRSPTNRAVGEGGADGGAAPESRGGAGADVSVAGSSGSIATGGSSPIPNAGGQSPVAAGGAGPSQCIDGAPCTCGDLTGTLACKGAESSDEGECSCPPANECQAPSGSCFEPCGGDALGLWVLEETCFPGAETGAGCAGGAIAGTSAMDDFRIEIFEDQPLSFAGGGGLELRAQVPLQCLGIESVNRCVDAEFYASALFFGFSVPLDCEASACGFCECSGKAWGGGGSGAPWVPGASTLSFGAVSVPYCVEGDTMWVGGGRVAGEPKVAYKLRRRSCTGKPLPCDEREPGQCGMYDDACQLGRCVSDGGDPAYCVERFHEEFCTNDPGCKWVPGSCSGTASDACDTASCARTPGCSWGAPKARCGGYPKSCFMLDPADCHATGCSMRTCDVPDGWGGVDGAPCERLTVAACAKAAGCTVSGGACTGNTLCGSQTDASVCAMLECAVYDEPTCGGFPTAAAACTDLSVEDCRSVPGCHLEW